jgi:hypothetical protein
MIVPSGGSVCRAIIIPSGCFDSWCAVLKIAESNNHRELLPTDDLLLHGIISDSYSFVLIS